MKSSIIAVLALVVLTACSYKPDNAGSSAGTGGSATGGTTAATTGSGSGAAPAASGTGQAGSASVATEPGSDRDFIVNVGDRVFFAFDSAQITSEGQSVLTRQATWLKTYPNKTLTIEGHCDERGTREYNLALGAKRANAVKDSLIGMGVNPDRLNTISYGKERPAVNGSDEGAWAQNRRGVSVVK